MGNNGWIQLHRSMLDWEWYTNVNTSRLFMHCLLKASHKDRSWRGINIAKGSFISGRDSLAKDTGLSIQNIRTSLANLKSTNDITILSRGKYSIISITNWANYQEVNHKTNHETNRELTDDQPQTNQKVTTDNNETIKQLNNVNKDQEPLAEQKTIRFDEFWLAYPKKSGKKDCLKKWKARNLDEKADLIIDSVRLRIKTDSEWIKGYIPNPTTFINGDRWEDEISNRNASKSGEQVMHARKPSKSYAPEPIDAEFTRLK